MSSQCSASWVGSLAQLRSDGIFVWSATVSARFFFLVVSVHGVDWCFCLGETDDH